MKPRAENPYTDNSDAADAAAVDWHVRISSGDMPPEEMADFERWLRRAPVNAEAYARLTAIWDGMAPLANSDLVRRGLGAQAKGPAVSRRAALSLAGLFAVLQGGMGAASTMAALSFAFVAGVAATQYDAVDESLYRTAIGERELVELPDGSTIVLNTASTVDVEYSPGERRVTLAEGQATFKVARDASRPFVVHAGGGFIRALGTEFDVYKSADGVKVTLIEGRVRVASADASSALLDAGRDAALAPAQVDLTPGQQAEIADFGVVSASEPVDVEQITAWREGKVSFRNTPLAEAVAEMNRYSSAQIALGDEALAELRVSGVFRVSNSGHFVNALESLFDIEARRSLEGGVVLQRSM